MASETSRIAKALVASRCETFTSRHARADTLANAAGLRTRLAAALSDIDTARDFVAKAPAAVRVVPPAG